MTPFSVRLQPHAPDLCVPVVEGFDSLRVGMQAAQWGVNGPEDCGRRVAEELSRRGDAQGVHDQEKKKCPGKPEKGASAPAAGRRGFVLRRILHEIWIRPWVATVNRRHD